VSVLCLEFDLEADVRTHCLGLTGDLGLFSDRSVFDSCLKRVARPQVEYPDLSQDSHGPHQVCCASLCSETGNVMNWSTLVPAMFVLVATVNLAQSADVPTGIVSGWESNSGSLLLGELNCAACHPATGGAEHLTKRQPPKLGEVGRRVTPQYLRVSRKAP